MISKKNIKKNINKIIKKMSNFFNLLTKESITALQSTSLEDKEKINYFFIF